MNSAAASKLFENDGTRVVVAYRKTLFDVWLECNAALFILDGAYDDKLSMPRSKG